jgi:hypothetical protein
MLILSPWQEYREINVAGIRMVGNNNKLIVQECTYSSYSSTGSQWLVPLEVLQPRRLIVRAWNWKFPLIPPAAPTPTTQETSSRERGKCGREMSGSFCLQIANSTLFKGIFYMPQICDTGPMALPPLRRKAC